jgi:hypothetical protein
VRALFECGLLQLIFFCIYFFHHTIFNTEVLEHNIDGTLPRVRIDSVVVAMLDIH